VFNITLEDVSSILRDYDITAQISTISELQRYHYEPNGVRLIVKVDLEDSSALIILFDPFTHNDLFAFDAFMSLEHLLEGEDKVLFDKIVEKYNSYISIFLEWILLCS